jgi:chromosome partitioning protein
MMSGQGPGLGWPWQDAASGRTGGVAGVGWPGEGGSRPGGVTSPWSVSRGTDGPEAASPAGQPASPHSLPPRPAALARHAAAGGLAAPYRAAAPRLPGDPPERGPGQSAVPAQRTGEPAPSGPVSLQRTDTARPAAAQPVAGGPMISGTQVGRHAAGLIESENTVASSVARDSAADTPIARAAQAAMLARAGSRQWPRPQSCRVVTVANQKGGVGKTTTAVNLAAGLAMHGARVLVIDLDPQGNASTAFDVEHRSGTASVYNVLVEGHPLAEVVVPVQGLAGLYCAPATIDLAGAEIELVSLVARESRLARAIQQHDLSGLDYLFIDCPPSLGLLTVNALVAAPEVLIPIQCEYYALEGLEQLLRTIELVQSHLNPQLGVSTILLTMYDGRTRLASQVAEEVRGHFGELVLQSVIPRSVRVSEAPSYGQSVMTYDPGSSGAVAYLDAAREIAFGNDQAVLA